MKFLSANWNHLLLANYEVEPQLLHRYVPQGTRLDDFGGRVFVSLVAFLFDNTRVLGMPIPYHRRFPEVNLRFYVTPEKDDSIRAVTFIKEIVPRSLIPFVANNLFGENYSALPMQHAATPTQHRYGWTNGSHNLFSGRVASELTFPERGSAAEFITEHYWGYSKRPKATVKYRVEHPPWRCCELAEFQIDVDFDRTYGREFHFLSSETPHSVLYAEGSAVTVSFPMRV